MLSGSLGFPHSRKDDVVLVDVARQRRRKSPASRWMSNLPNYCRCRCPPPSLAASSLGVTMPTRAPPAGWQTALASQVAGVEAGPALAVAGPGAARCGLERAMVDHAFAFRLAFPHKALCRTKLFVHDHRKDSSQIKVRTYNFWCSAQAPMPNTTRS